MRLIIFSTLLFLIACSGDDEAAACHEIGYNEVNQLEQDSIYCFEDGVEVTIKALNNVFCPCNVVCAWQGQMTIDMFWTFADGDTLSYLYNSEGQVFINEELPNEMVVSTLDEDIEFEEECSDANPSPKILSAGIMVSN